VTVVNTACNSDCRSRPCLRHRDTGWPRHDLCCLKEQNLFKPDSRIKNIPLVLSMLVRFANCLSVLDASGEGESMSLFAWVAVLHKSAEEAGIKIEGRDQTEADLSND